MRVMLAYRAVDGIAGGVERMSSAIMNELCARGHEIHFYTIDRKDAVSYYPIDERVTWHKLDMGDYKKKASWSLRIKRAIKARKIIRSIQPDVILAFQDGAFFSTRAYSLFMGIPVILAERISPQHFDFVASGKHKTILQHLYGIAHQITIQCESYRNMYPAFLRRKITTIPNPVFPADPKNIAAPHKSTKNGTKSLLCVGRLGYQKNQSVLLKAFIALADDFPDWVLTFAGDGEDYSHLQEIAAPLLQKSPPQIEFLGNVKDVPTLLSKSHLFCIPSRWEGFPNALSEALSHGLPAVGFSKCGGVCDLIQDGYNGLLAHGRGVDDGDQENLTNALRLLMRDDQKRQEMGKNAVQSVTQYAPEKIFDQWENLLQKISRKK